MKLNKSYFMGLFITFLMIGIAGIVAGVTIIDTNPDNELLHKGRLHTLYLGNSGGVIKVQSGVSYLSVLNGLIVGISVESSDVSGSVIGGGERNYIYSQNAGIAGGQNNRIESNSSYSAIGGGVGNIVWNGNNSVIAGGFDNRANYGAVIVGGENNGGNDYVVVLGGLNNSANGGDSLVMGSGARGLNKSFVWNDGSAIYSSLQTNSARIDALSGVLIGTGQSVSGVRLVVNGAVKLGSGTTNIAGEVRVDGNGCMWAFDGVTGHVLGKGSESGCTIVTGQCLFGSTLLQNGDKKKAYTTPYSENCEGTGVSIEIMCNDGMLCNGANCGNSYDRYFPYCYTVSTSDNPEYPGRYSLPKHRIIDLASEKAREAKVDVEKEFGGQQAGYSQNQGQVGPIGPKN